MQKGMVSGARMEVKKAWEWPESNIYQDSLMGLGAGTGRKESRIIPRYLAQAGGSVALP